MSRKQPGDRRDIPRIRPTPPPPPPNIVIKMGTFPPKPTTGWCWKHGRFSIPKTRSIQECPSCLFIEGMRVMGTLMVRAAEGVKEFSRSMERVAKIIQENFDTKSGGS